jgi:hypothetical protein
MANRGEVNSTAAAARRKAKGKTPSYLLTASPRALDVSSSNPARGSSAPASSKSPTLSAPTSTTRQVEIAPAPQPFLNPDDEGARNTEIASQIGYLSGLGQQLTSLQIDTNQKVADIEQGLSSGLEANDWNTAARGIGDSSIKAQNRARMTSPAASSTGAAKDQYSNLEKYVNGEKARVNETVIPGINTHYDAVAAQNARDVGPTMGEVTDVTPGTPVAAAPTAPAPRAPASDPGTATNTGTMIGKVKNGNFYHVYNPGTAQERWVYVRPAGA